jgi:hypothetical protein
VVDLIIAPLDLSALMALGYAKTPTEGSPEVNPNEEEKSQRRTTKSWAEEDTPPLQFVTTTSTVAIDESSKRVIRQHASRHVYRARPQPAHAGASSPATTRKRPNAATGGQIHRFRLGPQGLKHTPNQPPQVSQNFTILSLKEQEQPATKPVQQGPASTRGNHDDEDGPREDEFGGLVLGQPRGFAGARELVRGAKEQQQTWIEPFLFSAGSSLFGPSSGTMDPFNAMALPITPREQILLRYYCASLPFSI